MEFISYHNIWIILDLCKQTLVFSFRSDEYACNVTNSAVEGSDLFLCSLNSDCRSLSYCYCKCSRIHLGIILLWLCLTELLWLCLTELLWLCLTELLWLCLAELIIVCGIGCTRLWVVSHWALSRPSRISGRSHMDNYNTSNLYYFVLVPALTFKVTNAAFLVQACILLIVKRQPFWKLKPKEFWATLVA